MAVPSYFRVGLLPITTSSGISALKKGSLWVPLHTSQDAWLLSKSLQALNAGEDVEKREPSYIVGGNAN